MVIPGVIKFLPSFTEFYEEPVSFIQGVGGWAEPKENENEEMEETDNPHQRKETKKKKKKK